MAAVAPGIADEIGSPPSTPDPRRLRPLSHPIRVVRDDGLAPSFPAVAARGQLIVYEFDPGASFQGELGGALERAESGGAMRVLEAFFMQRDAETDELIVVDLRGDGAGGLIGPLLDFRLDRDARRRATERALAGGVPGVSGDALREFGSGLAPGAAIAAVLLEHVWAATLESAVARTGGRRVVSGFVDAGTLGELAPLIRDAVRPRDLANETP